MGFDSFTEVNNYLNGLMSETRSREHAYTLDNMKSLMGFLGDPQNSYKVIHVAGTSGKTSTCQYLSSLLKEAGKKVGMTVSPHVAEVNERVQINTRPLTEKKFCREFSLFVRRIQESGVSPSYFETLVAFAFWEFARQEVDYAVIEVGLGGLLDGTNVINRTDKACVITDIGYDHTGTLGRSIVDITAQKAGIVLPGNVVFAYIQSDDVMKVLREVSAQQQADLHEIRPRKPSELPGNLPLFQRRNWHLAYSVYKFLAERDGLPSLDKARLAATTNTYIPARMEIVKYKGKTVIMDAAHNAQKIRTLMRSVKHAYPDQDIACLASFVRSKQAKVRQNLEALLPAVKCLIITDFNVESSERFSTDPLVVAKQCDELGYENWDMVPEPAQALEKLLERKEDVLLITGSFFLLNIIRPSIITPPAPRQPKSGKASL